MKPVNSTNNYASLVRDGDQLTVFSEHSNSESQMELIRDDVRVEWLWAGEGNSGDYDPEDPEDEPLLRFYVARRDPDTGEFVDVDDGSFCTQVPSTAITADKVECLVYLMDEVHDPVMDGHSINKLCQRLSWIHIGWVRDR